MLDLGKLRKVAGSATSGPWVKLDAFNIDCPNCGEEQLCCDITSADEYKTAYIQVCGMEMFTEPNAQFIATCNPQTVLALIDRIEKLTDLVKEATFDHDFCSPEDCGDCSKETGCQWRNLGIFLAEQEATNEDNP